MPDLPMGVIASFFAALHTLPIWLLSGVAAAGFAILFAPSFGQLEKSQRWFALVRYIIERILAYQPKPNLGLTALPSD